MEYLRDENLILQVELFYNAQDLEIYEMTVLKYQNIYGKIQRQYADLARQVKALSKQRDEHAGFVDVLSTDLAACHCELERLYNVLNEEKYILDDQEIKFSQEQESLHDQISTLTSKLAVAEQWLDEAQKNNSVLELKLQQKDCEINQLNRNLISLNDKLIFSGTEISRYHDKVESLQEKLVKYQQNLAIAKMENETAERNTLTCVQRLKDMEEKFENNIKELEVLNTKCSKQVSIIDSLESKIQTLKADQNEEILKYQEMIQNHQEKCNKLKEEIRFKGAQLKEANENEAKIQADYKESEHKYEKKLSEYQSEKERLLKLVNDLEQKLNNTNCECHEKNQSLVEIKQQMDQMQNNQNIERRSFQDHICSLKSEMNMLIEKIDLLNAENVCLQKGVSETSELVRIHDVKKQQMITELNKCLKEIQQIKTDKEALLQKNEELCREIQDYHEAWEGSTATHSVATVDSIRSEGRNIVNTVRTWLAEQKKLNIELTEKMRRKNLTISKLKEDVWILENKIKSRNSSSQTRSLPCGRRRDSPEFTYAMVSPPLNNVWSLNSIESAGSNSEYVDHDDEETPQVWVHRVESLTEELQKSNEYWKNRMMEHEYIVSKDK